MGRQRAICLLRDGGLRQTWPLFGSVSRRKILNYSNQQLNCCDL